ncbi:hypothetical protein [Vibrio crassostreae]|uniref:hypothetical protein n=1 Tax=Vibrio crassostreae TaxID=246167 RepID=UPI001053A6E6|nr:hypothetical protein [Vibrio crassostreae]TCT61939.1 hypothetical protein EDB31_13656 [Vibrio crassostreae]
MAENVILQHRYELAQKVMQDPEHAHTYRLRWRKMEMNDIPHLKRQREWLQISNTLREGFKADVRGLLAVAERLKSHT